VPDSCLTLHFLRVAMNLHAGLCFAHSGKLRAAYAYDKIIPINALSLAKKTPLLCVTKTQKTILRIEHITVLVRVIVLYSAHRKACVRKVSGVSFRFSLNGYTVMYRLVDFWGIQYRWSLNGQMWRRHGWLRHDA
jgi:hypothetical protein